MEPNSDNIVDKSTTNALAGLSAFVAVAHAGSFTAAMRQTGIDKSLLSRRVVALETALNRRLLRRTTRRLALTEVGEQLLHASRGPLEALQSALHATERPEVVEGTVRVAVFPAIARRIMPEATERLRAAHPELRVEYEVGIALVNLIERGLDVAFRTGRMPDSTLTAQRLGRWQYAVVATPEWLDANGPLSDPADLAPHWILFGGIAFAAHWTFTNGARDVEVEMDAKVVADDVEAIVALIRQGLGASAVPRFYISEFIESGELVEVLPDWRLAGEGFGVYAVWPHREFLPAKTRAVIEAFKCTMIDAEMI